jgi:hypothetical protein
LSLNWPYEPTDTLLSTSGLGKSSDREDNWGGDDLMINPVFEQHLRNLNNWSLGPAFAKAHPGLADTVRIKQDDDKMPYKAG